MRIADAEISLSATRDYRLIETREERLRISVQPESGPQRPTLEISADAQALSRQAQTASAKQADAVDATDTDSALDDPKIRLLVELIERLTNRPVRLFDARDLDQDDSRDRDPNQPNGSAQSVSRAEGGGLEIDYQIRHSRSEHEHTSVIAQGVIATADGARINFSLSLDMQRAVYTESELRITMGNVQRKDPLVINFAGNAAALTDMRFDFDLDADGQTERVPLLRGASGLLALDHNRDGRINDGTELFGALTGDGFGELAAYDHDGNGWIDSADPVFAELRVWIPDANGLGQLLTLAEAGVGMIGLHSINSSFDLRGTGNSDLGQIRSTGLYVSTAGAVGTVQQIDFTV